MPYFERVMGALSTTLGSCAGVCTLVLFHLEGLVLLLCGILSFISEMLAST